MNRMKAPGVFGFSKVCLLLFLTSLVNTIGDRGLAEEARQVPALSFNIKKDSLTVSWPKSATNWLLSTQAVDARGWTYVPATQYGTNKSNIFVTTPVPAKETFYRLVKVSAAMRNHLGNTPQPPPPPIPPSPHPGGHPPRSTNSAPPR
jgi:hypothetical protein